MNLPGRTLLKKVLLEQTQREAVKARHEAMDWVGGLLFLAVITFLLWAVLFP